MNETIPVGLWDLYSGQYAVNFDLFALLFLGCISIIVLLFLLCKWILDCYIEDKIWEHKRGCKKTK